MKFNSDDIVTTRDGQEHRVIYRIGDKLFVKSCSDKHKKAYKIAIVNVVSKRGK